MIVDCDGQMSLTRFYFPDLDPDNTATVADVLLGDSESVWSDNTIPVDGEGKVQPSATVAVLSGSRSGK